MSLDAPDIAVMEGTGNRFAIMARRQLGDRSPASLVRKLVSHDPELDGLLLVSRGDSDEDLRVDVINADGSVAGMCGNGLRCVAFLAARDPGRVGRSFRIRMGDHALAVRVLKDEGTRGLVYARLPEPRVSPRPDGFEVDLGNPHRVIRQDHRPDPGDWESWFARRAETSEPDVNLHRVQVDDRRRIRMCSWERGVGPTAACGSGATAAVAAFRSVREIEAPVEVIQPGGWLRVNWARSGRGMATIGPVEHVGRIPLSSVEPERSEAS